MASSRTWSDADLAAVHAAREEGNTWDAIADLFGAASGDAVRVAHHRYLARNGPPVHQPPKFEDFAWPEEVGWREWGRLYDHINQAEKRSDPINQTLTVKLPDHPVAIAFAGDLHLGGGFTDHAEIESTIEFVLETPGLYLSLCGDIFEGFLPKFRSAEAREQMPGSVKSQLSAYRSLLNELMREGKLIACSYGDHDAMWFENAIGFNPAKHAIHDKVPYFPGRAIIRVHVGEQVYFVVQNHRERNASQWNRVHPSRRQFDRFFPGDVMVTGHTHSPSFQMDYQLAGARKAGLPVGGKVWYVVTGTFKTGPDVYTIRSWSRGVLGVPTVVFDNERRDTLCLPSPALAARFL